MGVANIREYEESTLKRDKEADERRASLEKQVLSSVPACDAGIAFGGNCQFDAPAWRLTEHL